MKPKSQELKLIRQHLAANFPEMTDEELAEKLYIQDLILADNLINSSSGKWSLESLNAMPEMLSGIKLILDHDWDEIKKTVGVIFEAEVVKKDTAPPWVLNAGGDGENNLKIIAKEGFVRVEGKCYFLQSDRETIEKTMFGLWESISLSFYYHNEFDVVCPTCQCLLKDCPHILRTEKNYLENIMLEDVENLPTIDYYIKPEVKAIVEASLVFKGMLPAIGLKTNRQVF